MTNPRQADPALSPASTLTTAAPETGEASDSAARRDPRLAKLSDIMNQAQQRGKISRPALEAFLKKRG